ncbi:hypothetical protein ABZ896_26485 [Streptomyces sp. NPDC047072]|uniref:hypothetical protein n=1 Tax=Streptomyces sp. NPDC047072 TaxID=3154809 RepID=UPI0033E901DA
MTLVQFHCRRCEVAVLERTSTTARYTRGAVAAVIAATTLILAANTGPAKADPKPAEQATQIQQTEDRSAE